MHTDTPIKDKNGSVLTSDEDLLKNWRERFEELLNRPPPQNPPDIAPAEEVLQKNCERSSKAEIEKAIYHTKRGKVNISTKGCTIIEPGMMNIYWTKIKLRAAGIQVIYLVIFHG